MDYLILVDYLWINTVKLRKKSLHCKMKKKTSGKGFYDLATYIIISNHNIKYITFDLYVFKIFEKNMFLFFMKLLM